MFKTFTNQSIKQIHLIVFNQFCIKKYYDDARRHQSLIKKQIINDLLHKDYEIFDD